MKEYVHIDPEFGAVRLRRRAGSRYIRLRVPPKGEVVVTVPWLTPWKAGIAFLESKREWVRRTLERQSQRQDAYAATDPQEPVTDAYIARLRAEAKRTLPPRLAELAARHGFVYNKVFIKHNRSNWGSCSTRGNINLNLNIVRLPEHLRDYILLHELVHLREMNHGPRFHALLEEVCPDHRALQREMKGWRLV